MLVYLSSRKFVLAIHPNSDVMSYVIKVSQKYKQQNTDT